MAGIFRAYDIRGIYGESLTEPVAEAIGRAFVTFLKCRKITVGRDMRPHSVPLFRAFAKGATEQGADVVDIGLCSTPMLYHATGLLKAEGGVMITASHNTAEWNGVKLTRADAVPISGATGIMDIEKIVNAKAFVKVSDKVGTITRHEILPAYKEHVKKFASLKRPVKVVADYANSMGALEAKTLQDLMAIEPMFEELDGNFPNHEANPLKEETLHALQAKIRAGQYDFGVAFDGDADRAGFVDEKGNVIPMDMITALVAQDLLSHEQGTILYDLRSSWAVKEAIEEKGGKPVQCRVGHAFIKQQMRENNAIFAGELSGHYYFRDNYTTESSAMATLCVANIVSRSDKPLSELLKPLRRYFASGEINSEVHSTEAVLKRLKEKYADGRMYMLDGVSVEYADWWFNVRASNTEPLIRLNLEAKSEATMKAKRDELLAEIRK